MSKASALEQIKKCKFKDEHGHPIENSVAFQELVALASIQLAHTCGHGAVLCAKCGFIPHDWNPAR